MTAWKQDERESNQIKRSFSFFGRDVFFGTHKSSHYLLSEYDIIDDVPISTYQQEANIICHVLPVAGDDYFQSCSDASRAPSAIALSLAQVISGSTWWIDRAKVAKPQSLPAITRSRPTTSA